MLDGCIWWEMCRAGIPEKRNYNRAERRQLIDWINSQARKRNWLK